MGRVENPVAPVRLNDCVAAGPCLEVFGAELTCGRLESAHLRDIYHLLNLDSSARPVRQTANCTTRNNLCFMSIVKNSKKQLIMHTVDPIAAGTLKITLMIEFKLRHMKIVAMKFEKKLP